MLAEAGGCRDLSHDLARHVVEAIWPAWARRAGLSAVAALGDDQDLLRLKDLARLGPDSDPVDSVLSGVIGALFPRLMDAAEVLALLRPARNAVSIGPYSELLSHLGARIPADDLPPGEPTACRMARTPSPTRFPGWSGADGNRWRRRASGSRSPASPLAWPAILAGHAAHRKRSALAGSGSR